MSIRGMARTKAALKEAEIRIRAATPTALESSGGVVARAMVSRAPRDTGRLASEIGVDVEGDTARVGSDAPYDRFVQRGTRYMSAQAYGEQAASAAAPGVVSAMAAVYKAALEGGW